MMFPDWRGWLGLSMLFMIVGVVVVNDQLNRVKTAGPSITMMSGLLDWDLPGTLPHPDRAGATARLRSVAERLHVDCGEVEVFQTAQPAVLHSTLEDAQAERHYLRYRDKKNPGLSHWEGPNRILMVEAQDELLLCQVNESVIG